MKGTPIEDLVLRPPTVGAWVPEVAVNALAYALRDRFFEDDPSYRAWVDAASRSTLASLIYKLLFRVAGPHRLVRGGSRKWSALRRGTGRRLIALYENGSRGAVEFPVGLYDRFHAEIITAASRAALELSSAPEPVIEFVEFSDTRFVTEARFDRAKPLGQELG